MAYWRYPVKAKSSKTVERNSVLKEYDNITSQNKLEKLSNRELKSQKNSFKDELEKLNSKYSISKIEEKLKEFQIHTNKINKLAKNVKDLCEKYKNQLKTSKEYYLGDTFFYKSCLIIEKVHHNGSFNLLIKAEQDLFLYLKSKEYNNLLLYFSNLLNLIGTHYLVYDLELFENNKNAWSIGNYPNIVYAARTFLKEKTYVSFIDTLNSHLNTLPIYNYKNGGYFYMMHNSYSEFIKINKAPSYEDEGRNWSRKFSNFSKCSKNDHKYSDLVLRFDETGYREECKKWKSVNDYHLLLQNEKSTELWNHKAVNITFYKKYFKLANEALNKVLRKIDLIERGRIKKLKKEEGVGYVYILKSVGYPGMYKIGSTYGLPEERAEELSGTNVPDPWTVTGKIRIKDAEYYEKQVHKILSEFRYRKGREFFKLDLNIIKDCLRQVSDVTKKGTLKLKFSQLQKKNDI